MRFRLAEEKDFDELEALCEEFHKESRFSYILYDGTKLRKIGKKCVTRQKTNGIVLAIASGRKVEFAHYTAGEYFAGKGIILTTLHAIYVERNVRSSLCGGRVAIGLLVAARNWAKSRKSTEIVAMTTSGISAQKRPNFFAKSSFTAVTRNYACRI